MAGRKAVWVVVAATSLMAGSMAAREASAQGNSQLPFSNTYSRPALSPYNQLQQNIYNPLASQTVYQQQIQPQLQQQQQQLQQVQQTRQLNKLQNQVQQVQRDTRGRQIDETIRPTGHASTYQNLSHFYPARR
jgi:TolA-binding protein